MVSRLTPVLLFTNNFLKLTYVNYRPCQVLYGLFSLLISRGAAVTGELAYECSSKGYAKDERLYIRPPLMRHDTQLGEDDVNGDYRATDAEKYIHQHLEEPRHLLLPTPYRLIACFLDLFSHSYFFFVSLY